MKYCISLEGLELECIIGILSFERKRRQKISIDVEFIVESKGGRYVDYCLLRDFIIEAFKREFGLLEEAHEYFLDTIPEDFPQIKEFWIKITKLEVFKDCRVAIKSYYKE